MATNRQKTGFYKWTFFGLDTKTNEMNCEFLISSDETQIENELLE